MIVWGILLLLIGLGGFVFVWEMFLLFVIVGVLILSGVFLVLGWLSICGIGNYWKILFYVIGMGIFISVYLILDVLGVCIFGNVIVFVGWLLLLDGLFFLLMVLCYLMCMWKFLVGYFIVVFVGGGFFMIVYVMVVYVMSLVFMVVIFVFCEISVVFVIFIGVYFFKELFGCVCIFVVIVMIVGVVFIMFF